MRFSSFSSVLRAASLFGSYVIVPVLTILIFTDVIMRYVFNSPLWWTFETSCFLLLLFFLSGLADSVRSDVHVRMSIFSDALPRAGKRVVSLIYASSLVFVFALILQKVIENAQFYYKLGSTTNDLKMPLWIWYSGIALVSVLVILQVLFLAIDVILGHRDMLEDVSNDTGKH